MAAESGSECVVNLPLVIHVLSVHEGLITTKPMIIITLYVHVGPTDLCVKVENCHDHIMGRFYVSSFMGRPEPIIPKSFPIILF